MPGRFPFLARGPALPLTRRSPMARIALVLTLLASWAVAGKPGVGEDAPEFGNATWVMNAPAVTSLADLRGDVVIVEKWGVKCPPCLALIPHIEKLQNEYGSRGLHIFAFEAQNHSAEEILATVTSRGGKSYPVAAGGAGNYQTDGGIPHAWIIGVDGKVVWEGNPGARDFDRTLMGELAKVKYPGLGKTELHSDLDKALREYLKGDLGAALKEAQRLAERAGADEQAVADARHMASRIEGRLASQQQKAEKLAAEREYVQAAEVYSWIAQAFNKTDAGDAATKILKDWRSDRDVRREISAAEDLEKLLEHLKRATPEARARDLTRFAEANKYSGTKAAERALAAAGR